MCLSKHIRQARGLEELTKLTLKNLDGLLKKLSFHAFGIDDPSRIILGIIAKKGPLNETRITRLGNSRIILSREIIRRRLLKTDLSNDFVSEKKGRKIGNLQNKQERIFSLTLKGILASLFETKLSDNYWIKNYISNIEKITNKTIAQLFLQNIYHCILLHLILNANTGGSLSHSSSSQKDIKSRYDSFGNLHHAVYLGNDIEAIPLKYKDLFASSAIQFYISCITISNLLYDLKLPSKYLVNYVDDRESPSDFIKIFFENWMYSIFQMTEKTPEHIFVNFSDDQNYDNTPLNFMDYLGPYPTEKLENLAKKSYLELNPKGKFDSSNTLLFPKPI